MDNLPSDRRPGEERRFERRCETPAALASPEGMSRFIPLSGAAFVLLLAAWPSALAAQGREGFARVSSRGFAFGGAGASRCREATRCGARAREGRCPPAPGCPRHGRPLVCRHGVVSTRQGARAAGHGRGDVWLGESRLRRRPARTGVGAIRRSAASRRQRRHADRRPDRSRHARRRVHAADSTPARAASMPAFRSSTSR